MNVSWGVSTFLWTSPFKDEDIGLFLKIKEMGYDVVEIGVEAVDHFDADLVKSAADDSGLKLSVCGAFGAGRDLTHPDPAVVQQSLDYIEGCLDLAASWGCPHFAGPMYSAVGKARMIPDAQRKQEWEQAVKHLKIVCEKAEARGVSIAIEPLNRFETDLVNTTADAVRLVKDIDHPAARIALDGFHLAIEETDMETAIRSAGNLLTHFQVSENHRGIPGTGQTDWAGISRGLEAIDYHGMIVIESFTPEIKELAGAVCFWRHLADSQDQFAEEGLKFLKETISTNIKETAE